MSQSNIWIRFAAALVIAGCFESIVVAQFGSGFGAGGGAEQSKPTVRVQDRDGIRDFHPLARVKYRYALGSMRPQQVSRQSDAMMDEGSSYGMGMGMDMGMDMGSMEGAMDGGMGESGGMSPGGGLRHMPRTITIFALRMERQPAPATDASSGEGPVSGALATFMLAVSSDDARALPEPRTASLEGMSGEMMGGMGMEMAVEEPLVRLELLAGRNLGMKRQPQIFSASEIKLVADTIRQQLSRDLLVQDLTRHANDAEYLKRTEPVLKQLLADQYETQIARQQFEIDAIAAKVKLLQSEFARRQAAKDRVVEIQTGRIVLEAQGLLNP